MKTNSPGRLLDRVLRFLRLARDQEGQPEGEVAARHARRYAERYGIDLDALLADAAEKEQPNASRRIWPGGGEDRGEDQCGPGGPTYWRRVLLSAIASAADCYATHEFYVGFSTVDGKAEDISRVLDAYDYLHGWILLGLRNWRTSIWGESAWLSGQIVDLYTDADFCMSATIALHELRLKAEVQRRSSNDASSVAGKLEARGAPEPAPEAPPIGLIPPGTALARIRLYPHRKEGAERVGQFEKGQVETPKAPRVHYRRVQVAEAWAAGIPWPPPGWVK